MELRNYGVGKMEVNDAKLLKRAKSILAKNWRENYTVPAPTLYPHQWNWDSAFVSIGYSYYDQKKAQKELLSIFEGQWANGMLPHIVFRSKRSDYFPGPDYWQTALSKNALAIETSGITQPPLHAIAALAIYRNAKEHERAKDFLIELFPKILAFNRYLLRERDPESSGLVTIFHPWESGLDNSVRWDAPLSRIEVHDLPEYERVDVTKVSSDERPSDAAYDKYVYLIEIMKRCNYNEQKIYDKIPFKVKDVVFSTILYAANKAMIDIAAIIGEDDEEIKSWLHRTLVIG